MNKCDHKWGPIDPEKLISENYICSLCGAEINGVAYRAIAQMKTENLRLKAEVQFIEKCKNDTAKAEYTSNKRMAYIQQLVTEKADLLKAARLILNSFAYAPGKGPEWYEATRTVVAKMNGEI